MCRGPSHTGEHKTECEVDSRSELVLNWMKQENSRTAFAIAQDKLSRMELAFQTLESKAGVLTGFLSAILVAGLGYVADGRLWYVSAVTLLFLSLSICLLLVCLLSLVLCLTTRPWTEAPGWRQFDSNEEYGRDPARYRCQQVSNMRQSWEANAVVLHSKVVLFKDALWLMFAGILCLAAASLMAAL